MVPAVVWRIPLPGTLGLALVSSVVWLILAPIILDECEGDSIIIFIKLTITINVKEELDLLLWISLDVSLAEHRVQHGQVGRVRGQAGRVSNGSHMVVEVGGQVRVDADLASSSAWVMGFSGAVMAIILALVAAEAVGGHVAGAGGVKEPLASCLTDKQVISLRVTAILRDLSRTFSILHI